jgi:predicted nucleic acid-binding protein
MIDADEFFDTSVLLYLVSHESDKADRVEQLLEEHGIVSVQVLNEFAAVALRKLKMPLSDVREILETVRAVCTVEPLTAAVYDRGLAIYDRYKYSLYDSMIVASALVANAKVLYSENLQHGQLMDSQLRILNPFVER